MNRAERRANGIKSKSPTFNLTAEAIQAIKEEEQKKSVDMAFILLLTIPTMVIRDKFGELMRKEAREEKFVKKLLLCICPIADIPTIQALNGLTRL